MFGDSRRDFPLRAERPGGKLLRDVLRPLQGHPELCHLTFSTQLFPRNPDQIPRK